MHIDVRRHEGVDPDLFLMGADNVKIAGQSGFARIHRLVPGEGEGPPAKEVLDQVVVRKGATIFVEEYGANDLDFMLGFSEWRGSTFRGCSRFFRLPSLGLVVALPSRAGGPKESASPDGPSLLVC